MFELTQSPQDAPDESEEIVLQFKNGIPVALNEQKLDLTPLFIKLNELGSKHGIGRIDIVESRFVGMKSRGVYETPRKIFKQTDVKMRGFNQAQKFQGGFAQGVSDS